MTSTETLIHNRLTDEIYVDARQIPTYASAHGLKMTVLIAEGGDQCIKLTNSRGEWVATAQAVSIAEAAAIRL